MSQDIFDCPGWEDTPGIQCVKTRDAVKHSIMRTTKNYLVQNVSSAVIERPDVNKNCMESSAVFKSIKVS